MRWTSRIFWRISIIIVLGNTLFSGRLAAFAQPPDLRAFPQTISVSQATELIRRAGFYERRLNPQQQVTQTYRRKLIAHDVVILDDTHNLIWATEALLTASHQNVAEVLTTFNYAGSHDWRLPTLAELLSLLQPADEDGHYCHPFFQHLPTQGTISADLATDDDPARVWFIDFAQGTMTTVARESAWPLLLVRNPSRHALDGITSASVRGLQKR